MEGFGGVMRRFLCAVLMKTVALAGPAPAVTVNLAVKRLRAGRLRRTIPLLVRVGVVVGVAAVLLPSGAAQALGGFHTSGNSVRVRSGASTQASQVSFIPAAGTAIDIACQTAGQTVSLPGWGTSPIWDKLDGYGGGYISDLFVSETSYARFDPRLPQCGASPAPTASNPAAGGSLGGGVNMQSACNAQYPGRGLTATATDSKNAYSWKCVGSGVSLGIDVGSQCRAQYGAGAVAAVANPASAWSWYCYNPASSSGEACVFNDPRLLFGLAGHVGWAFELPGGNWEFGANEGPKLWPLVKADVSKTTNNPPGSEATMLAWFINRGGYTRYRCVTVPAFNASAAEQQVSREQNELYGIPSQDCESQTYNVLKAYGVKNLPNDLLDPVPNNWFNGLSSAGFGGPTSL
jgi:hypothetical protein